jgi:dienelactone hydrolase
VHFELATIEGGICERSFTLDRDRNPVPGLLWTPEGATGERPLILVGHGGSGNKRQDYVRSLVRRFVGRRGFAAAAIDGPVHGDRRPDGGKDSRLVFLDFAKAWSSDASMTDAMVADWRAVLDRLQELDDVGAGPVGYWGVSMGTILGLPLVAAEPRIRAAVLGLMGLTGPTEDRIRADAPLVRCPVLFLVQWDDSLFARDAAFALYDLVGSKDKRLHANPGPHGAVPPEEFEASERFFARHLLPRPAAT